MSHDPGCDVLDIDPAIGYATKPCNCRPKPCSVRVVGGPYAGYVCCGDAGHYIHFITSGRPEGGHVRVYEWETDQ